MDSTGQQDQKTVSIDFGYWPIQCSLKTDVFSISTMPDLQEIVENVSKDTNVDQDWFYPGLQKFHNVLSGKVYLKPFCSRIFALPHTHTLTLYSTSQKQDADFAVWCLSFFIGMRLTTTEAGFLDATPIRPGKLVDFHLSNNSWADVIHLSQDYIEHNRNNPMATKRIMAVINALFLSHYPQSLCFEQFQYLYLAIDACWKLVSDHNQNHKRTPHSGRIMAMCQFFNIEVPMWANCNLGQSEVPVVRNNLMHEALFFGEPLGFSIYGGNERPSDSSNILLEMQALICRLIVAILGRPESDYIKSPVNTRQRHLLKLNP